MSCRLGRVQLGDCLNLNLVANANERNMRECLTQLVGVVFRMT